MCTPSTRSVFASARIFTKPSVLWLTLARPALSDDVTYKLARALHRGEAAIAKRLDQARETTAANTVAAAPKRELIHPGVARYLAEAGLLK